MAASLLGEPASCGVCRLAPVLIVWLRPTAPPRPAACDFLTALKNNAVRGSLCYGTKCEGKFVYPNA